MYSVDKEIKLLDNILEILDKKILKGDTEATKACLKIKACKTETIIFCTKVNKKLTEIRGS